MTEQENTPENISKVKTVTIELSEPIEWGKDNTITELKLRRPKGKDLKNLSSEPTMGELLSVAQRCAGVPKTVMDDLDGADAMEVVEVIGDFLDSGQKTGRKRSYS